LKDSGLGTPVTLKIDKQGFYLYWVDQNHEMDLLDIATIRDVRTGQYAKKPKVINTWLLSESFMLNTIYFLFPLYENRI
jgi:phosphatidylinositol phospholipase C beta